MSNNKQQLLQGFASLDGAWSHVEDIHSARGMPMDLKTARDAAYNAYVVGHLEKHTEEPNTYRITEKGKEWLANYKPRKSRKPRKPRKPPTPKAKAKADGLELGFGDLLEVVATDGKGDVLARSLDSKRAYRVTEL